MRIDQLHRGWIVATTAGLIASAAVYGVYAATTPGGPRGGTFWGLVFGILGYAAMLYAGLLGVRKKWPTWRVGRAQTWMRGHLWLGLLSLPLILFHAGFAWRGPLTAVLMALMFAVISSGIFGAVLQHYLPRLMTAEVPLETIYEEIPHVREQLRAEADALVERATQMEEEHDDKIRFKQLYATHIRPHLDQPPLDLITPLRPQVAPAFRDVLDELEDICEEQRQLTRQRTLYHWLHGWQLVHVPLSIAVLVLGAVHAIMALRY